jgi:hypothetical protein
MAIGEASNPSNDVDRDLSKELPAHRADPKYKGKGGDPLEILQGYIGEDYDPPKLPEQTPDIIPGFMDALPEPNVGFFGGLKRGYLQGQQKPGIDSEERVYPRWSLPAYKPTDPLSVADLTDAGMVGYRLGRVGADIAGSGMRHNYWRWHPADLGFTKGYEFIASPPGGLPRDSLAAGAVATGGAFLATELMGQFSGNQNLLNPMEGNRPAGFQAITPDEDDPTKSLNAPIDIAQRYFLGRRGRILDWDEFSQERPDVSYEKYRAYRNWQSGKTPDPIGQATLGVLKFNPDGIQNQPEVQFVGYNVTPTGLVALGGTATAFRLLNQHLGRIK